MKMKKSLVCMSVITSLVSVVDTVQADVLNFQWNGLFTMLTSAGTPLTNTSFPYYDDPTWGYGLRTQVSGDFQFNTNTGYGTGSISPFEFFSGGPAIFHDIQFQAIGDGFGGNGSLMAGSMLFDWKGNNNINVGIVMDASGLFGALASGVSSNNPITGGAIPASDDMKGNLPIGGAVMATTNYNTEYHNYGIYISSNDTVGGSPMDNGPFLGFNINLDVTTMNFIQCLDCGPVVPLPATMWLFGSGLIGLLGVAYRRNG